MVKASAFSGDKEKINRRGRRDRRAFSFERPKTQIIYWSWTPL